MRLIAICLLERGSAFLLRFDVLKLVGAGLTNTWWKMAGACVARLYKLLSPNGNATHFQLQTSGVVYRVTPPFVLITVLIPKSKHVGFLMA